MMNTMKKAWKEVKEGIVQGMYESNANRMMYLRATDLLKKHGIQADVIVMDHDMGTIASVMSSSDLHLMGLSYTPKHDTVLILNQHSIESYALRLPTQHPVFIDITLDNMVDIVLAHELGHLLHNHVHSNEHAWKRDTLAYLGTHSMDTHLPYYALMGELTLEQETEAWHTGRAHIKDTLVPMYNMFNQLNVDAYKKVYNNALKEVRFK